MRLSVIIPSFNAGTYLAATLRSVACQGYHDLEVLIIDGGSEDSTPEVVRDFAFLITRFICEQDSGQLDAVQKGLRLATGDVVYWLNADDIVMPGTFNYVMEKFAARPTIEMIYSDNFAFDAVSHKLYAGSTNKGLNLIDHVLFYRQLYSECVFWRRSATRLLDCSWYDLRVYTDYALLARIKWDRNALWVPKRLGAFRVVEGQASSAFRARKKGEYCRIRAFLRHEAGWSRHDVCFKYLIHLPSFFVRHVASRSMKRGLRWVLRMLTGDSRRRLQATAFFDRWISPTSQADTSDLTHLLFR